MEVLDLLPLISLLGLVFGLVLTISIRKHVQKIELELLSLTITTLFGLIGVLNTLIMNCSYKEGNPLHVVLVFVVFLIILFTYRIYSYKKKP